MSKSNKATAAAQLGWARKTVGDMFKTHRKYPNPRTNGIEVSYLDAMIQLDIGKSVDNSCIMLGRDEYRTKQEMIADQLVDAAKGRLADWEENEENFKNHVRYDIPAMAKRAAAMMNEVQGSGPDTIHNTSALEQAEEFKARRLDRRISWRIDFWNRRYKDLKYAVKDAIQKQKDMRDSLDERLNVTEEEVLFIDERTKEQAFIEHYMRDMDRGEALDEYLSKKVKQKSAARAWTDEDLCMTLTAEDFCPEGTYGLISYKANMILNERLAATWKRAKAEKTKLIEEIIHEDRTGTGPVSKGERHWRTIDINQKAVKAHGTKEAQVLMLEHIIPMLGWMLVKEGKNLVDKKVKKLHTKEMEFWDRQEDPLRAVGVEEVDRFWFDDDNGGYLEGSCTDIKYICNDGSIAWDEASYVEVVDPPPRKKIVRKKAHGATPEEILKTILGPPKPFWEYCNCGGSECGHGDDID